MHVWFLGCACVFQVLSSSHARVLKLFQITIRCRNSEWSNMKVHTENLNTIKERSLVVYSNLCEREGESSIWLWWRINTKVQVYSGGGAVLNWLEIDWMRAHLQVWIPKRWIYLKRRQRDHWLWEPGRWRGFKGKYCRWHIPNRGWWRGVFSSFTGQVNCGLSMAGTRGRHI